MHGLGPNVIGIFLPEKKQKRNAIYVQPAAHVVGAEDPGKQLPNNLNLVGLISAKKYGRFDLQPLNLLCDHNFLGFPLRSDGVRTD